MPSDNGPLTDADRARIRAEEVERAKVRAELEAEAPSVQQVEIVQQRRGGLGCFGWGVVTVLGIIVLFFVLLVIGAGSSTSSSTPAAFTAAPSGPVTYTVTSSCHTNVTYVSDGGSTQQESDRASGWTKTVTPGNFASISAQISCEGGHVTVSIEQGGQVLKDATSSGDYVIADASTGLQ